MSEQTENKYNPNDLWVPKPFPSPPGEGCRGEENRYTYAMNNPLVYTDPSGEIIGVIVGAVVGAYIGGVRAEEGELNPDQWEWDKDTWAGIGAGAAAGALLGGAVEMAIAGDIGVSIGASTPAGKAGIDMANSDMNFTWSTAAGGGGSIDFSTTESAKKWEESGPYYPVEEGIYNTEEKIFRTFAENYSKRKNIEISYYYTERGFYLERTEGFVQNKIIKTDAGRNDVRYYWNTRSECYAYTKLDRREDNTYLKPDNGIKAKVYYSAHFHPKSSKPSGLDIDFAKSWKIPLHVYGWNNKNYYIIKSDGSVYDYWSGKQIMPREQIKEIQVTP